MSYWKQRRVLVTGGGGFIGFNLVERLVREGARVRVAENFERTRNENLAALGDAIELIEGDLRQAEVCARACSETEVVFHLASRVGSSDFYRRFPADVLLHNLSLDAHLLEAARERHVGRYLHVSSAFIYPADRVNDASAGPLREEEAYPANPANSYGWAKLTAERAVEATTEQDGALRAAIFRLSNVYGPHQSTDLERGSIVPVLVRRAVEYPALKPFSIRGTGEETRTYCYVADVVEAMLRAIQKLDGQRLVGPLNVGSEDSIRIVDLARKVIAVSGKEIELVTLPAPPPTSQSQTLDCSKARRVLDGWQPTVSLDEGLALLYRHVEAEQRQRRA
jgi:nucleoside-diphosphate-sugar epimerase